MIFSSLPSDGSPISLNGFFGIDIWLKIEDKLFFVPVSGGGGEWSESLKDALEELDRDALGLKDRNRSAWDSPGCRGLKTRKSNGDVFLLSSILLVYNKC